MKIITSDDPTYPHIYAVLGMYREQWSTPAGSGYENKMLRAELFSGSIRTEVSGRWRNEVCLESGNWRSRKFSQAASLPGPSSGCEVWAPDGTHYRDASYRAERGSRNPSPDLFLCKLPHG